jgi:pyruvate/2-oxoglutarate dehydrogenase complex dihydrolipoamide dehydrogenase (E3) component
MPRHVVVLGGGVSGEAFIARLRRLDKESRITLVENELVGGECSYWACIPSKTLLRPSRSRFAPERPRSRGDLDPSRSSGGATRTRARTTRAR